MITVVMQMFDTFGSCHVVSGLSARSNLKDREIAVPSSEKLGSCGQAYRRSRPRAIASRRLSQFPTTSMRSGLDYAPNMNGCRSSAIDGTRHRGAKDTGLLNRRTRDGIC